MTQQVDQAVRERRCASATLLAQFLDDMSFETFERIEPEWPRGNDASTEAALHIMRSCAEDRKRAGMHFMADRSWKRLLRSAHRRLAEGEPVEIELLAWTPLDLKHIGLVGAAAAFVFAAAIWALV